MKFALIDDEVSSLEIMKETLRPAGYECEIFENPVEALDAIKESKFDVVVTDFRMPELNGIEVLKAVKEISPDTYVIILTGYADIYNAIEAVNSGAYAFFRKPLNVEDFMDRLHKIEKELITAMEREANLKRLSNEYTSIKKAFDGLHNIVKKSLPLFEEKLLYGEETQYQNPK